MKPSRYSWTAKYSDPILLPLEPIQDEEAGCHWEPAS